jgi:AcrR family transcriptional regulator
MGTTERKAREKEELRDLILQGANKLFVEKGIEQTTIRSIANAIDYSVGTVYVYFKDKNEILHALHTKGFIDLSSRFKVLYMVGDPMERLRAMGKVYIQFAKENPDMYDLMFNIKAPVEFLNEKEGQDWNEGKATFNVLRTTTQACMEAGHFKEHDLEPLAFMIWSLVHGMCSLDIGLRAKGVNLEDPEHIVEKAYHEFLKIMEKL